MSVIRAFATWIPFSEEMPPKGKYGEKRYIFILRNNTPIVLSYFHEQFEPDKHMTHWFPMPEILDE